MKVVLIASHDRGGANLIAALLENSPWLQRQQLLVLAEGPAATVFGRSVFVTKQITQLPDPKCLKPDLVVCGTSFHAELERNVIQWANDQGIPSASLIDSWMNLAGRYWHARLCRYGLPTLISVVDEGCRSRLLEELGELAPSVVVGGQPYLQHLARQRVDSAGPAGAGVLRVLFCSEPMYQAYNKLGGLGYDQFSVFDQLIRLFERKKLRVVVELKLHPSEELDSWSKVLNQYQRLDSVVIERTEEELQNAFPRADFVVGLTSMALLEAVLAGKRAFSCQFGRKQNLAAEITQYMEVCESPDDFWECIDNRRFPDTMLAGLATVVEDSAQRIETALVHLAEG